MTPREQRGHQAENKGLLVVAIVALVLAVIALAWGIRTLARLGAFERLDGQTAAPPAVTSMPVPTTGSTPQQAFTTAVAPAALVDTPLPTLQPLRLRTAVSTSVPTPTASPSPVGAPDPRQGPYEVEYLGCIKHGSGRGTVKGQVYDRQGNVVVRAEVRVTLNDWTYDTPGVTNEAGWYEFYLDNGLQVKIVSLRIQGQEVPLAGHEDLIVKAQSGCYENVNLRQR